MMVCSWFGWFGGYLQATELQMSISARTDAFG
jgi:hypothetical protein